VRRKDESLSDDLGLPNPPSNFHIISFTGCFGEIPDHLQAALDARRQGATTEAYGNNTPQGGASEGNAADDALLVDLGAAFPIDTPKNVW